MLLNVRKYFLNNRKEDLKFIFLEKQSLYYQGSYEKDFLDKYYDLFEITKIDFINYTFYGDRVYYPDFYLPKYNLIIEIKSSYTYEKFLEKNNSKQKACLELGYNHIFIIDKNYDDFDKITL